jgi:hypothetical protein
MMLNGKLPTPARDGSVKPTAALACVWREDLERTARRRWTVKWQVRIGGTQKKMPSVYTDGKFRDDAIFI